VLNKSKAFSASLVEGGLFHDPHFGCLTKKNPLPSNGEGFFFVAECDEISNLNLVDDIIKILEFLDSE